MTNMLRPPIGAALLGKTREAVIGLLYSTPDLTLHVREIARRTGFSAPTVARELRLLEGAGVLKSAVSGRQVNYRPDPACSLFAELRSIASKTWGIRGRVGAAIERLAGIDCAFIFGSFAAGDPHQASDVDLLVIGSVDFAVLSDQQPVRRCPRRLARGSEARRVPDGEGNRLLTLGCIEQTLAPPGVITPETPGIAASCP